MKTQLGVKEDREQHLAKQMKEAASHRVEAESPASVSVSDFVTSVGAALVLTCGTIFLKESMIRELLASWK